MTIIRLTDGTSYYIDTDDEFDAEYVVKYKLKDRLDYRFMDGITSEILEDVTLKKDSKYYNSADAYDEQPLKCKTGWSYKWSNTKCGEFR